MTKLIVGQLINRRLDKSTGSTIKCTEYTRIVSKEYLVNLFSVTTDPSFNNNVNFYPVGRRFLSSFWINKSLSGENVPFQGLFSKISGYKNLLVPKTSILHCHTFSSSKIAYAFRKFTKVPMIYDLHGIRSNIFFYILNV